MTRGPTPIPSEQDFLVAFGIEPLECRPADGYWSYFLRRGDGHGVRLSLNAHERSVQTAWELNGTPVCTVVHENAKEVRIEDERTIRVSFWQEGDLETNMEIRVLPSLEISWSTLRV